MVSEKSSRCVRILKFTCLGHGSLVTHERPVTLGESRKNCVVGRVVNRVVNRVMARVMRFQNPLLHSLLNKILARAGQPGPNLGFVGPFAHQMHPVAAHGASILVRS